MWIGPSGAALALAIVLAQAEPPLPRREPFTDETLPLLVQALREQRSLTADLAAAHEASLRYLPPRVLSAELELVCEGLRHGREEARERLKNERSVLDKGGVSPGPGRASPGRRLRIAILVSGTRRIESARWCRKGAPAATRLGTPGRVVARRLTETLRLLDLPRGETRRFEGLLLAPDRSGGTRNSASIPDRMATVMEASEWLGLHDALLRHLVALQLTLHPGEGGSAGPDETQATRRLRKALSAAEEGDCEVPPHPGEQRSAPGGGPTTRT